MSGLGARGRMGKGEVEQLSPGQEEEKPEQEGDWQRFSSSSSSSKLLQFFVLTKFHFDKTISLAWLLTLSMLLMFFMSHLWKLHNGIIFVILEQECWDLVLLISSCFHSKILKKNPKVQSPTERPFR